MRTYSDEDGSFIEILDDQDGLGLAEVRWVDSDGREYKTFNLPVDMLEEFLSAAQEFIRYHKEN
jgi:hypothetical protein